ncbi:MAG TPA: hypothetical protein VFH06_00745 [Candidatus Saccharimonadales bacterium]|nr:hypothetical protein [Candidatus Saccharimonadales bacterium]
MSKRIRQYLLALGVVVGLVGASPVLLSEKVAAADGEFYLQVSPSPLVVTIKPGQTMSYELKVRNAGSAPEKLKIAPRSFSIDNNSGQVSFDDTKKPSEIGDWTSFSAPNFTVQPGEWFTEKVTLAIPKEAGFSYSFALVITRQDEPAPTGAQRELKGSVAVFALVNIDKPGATRTLELGSITTDRSFYEYLPATINVQLRNTGNSIVRPAGNVFIQRGSNDANPISALPVNKNEGYILPGSVRTLAIDWNDGFPGVKSSTNAEGTHTESDWSTVDLSKLRIGYYTAKLVAIYNDGQRDIPITGEVGFWIIPWKIILGIFLVVALTGFGLWSVVYKVFRSRRHKKRPVSFRK